MDRKQTAVVLALEQSQAFLDANASVLQAVNTTDTRRALDDVITQLKSMTNDQSLHARVISGARAKQVTAKRVLLEHSMRAIVSVARANMPAAPELAGLAAATSARVPNKTLITAANSMAQFATQHAAAFGAALGTDFLAALQSATNDFQSAVSQGKAARMQRTAVTTGIDDQITRGRRVLKVLDYIVSRALAGNVQLLQEWQTRRKISGSSHSTGESAMTQATQATQATPPAASAPTPLAPAAPAPAAAPPAAPTTVPATTGTPATSTPAGGPAPAAPSH